MKKNPCNHLDSAVKDSRPYTIHNETVTKRRRECLTCGERFTTFELQAEQLINVTSRDIETKIKSTLENVCKSLYSEILEETLIEDYEATIVRPGTAVVRYLKKVGRKAG